MVEIYQQYIGACHASVILTVYSLLFSDRTTLLLSDPFTQRFKDSVQSVPEKVDQYNNLHLTLPSDVYTIFTKVESR